MESDAATATTDRSDPTLFSEIKDGDKAAKVTKLKKWYRDSYDATEEFRADAEESYKFVEGGEGQWSAADIEVLKNGPGGPRPMLTINQILKAVLFLSGNERQQRTEPKLIGEEPGDTRSAEIMGVIYKWVSEQSQESYLRSRKFVDKVVCGMGYRKIVIDFDQDPEGTPKWIRPHPLSVFPDPNFFAGGCDITTWRDMEYCFHADWLTLDKACEQWPEHKDAIKSKYGPWLATNMDSGNVASQLTDEAFAGDPQSDKRYFWDAESQRLRVLEGWYVLRVPVQVAIITNPDGEPIVLHDQDQVKQLREMLKMAPEMQGRITFTRRNVRQVYVCHLLHDILLDDELTPFGTLDEIPIWPDPGHFFWKKPFGIVHPMKDPQREKNRRRSTMTEIAMRAANSGWKNHKTRGATAEDLKKSSGVGIVINYEEIAPAEITPPEMPQALVLLERMADQEILSVVNIHNELLGNTTARTVSGRAIEARQRSGMVAQEPLIDTTLLADVPAVKGMIKVIQQYISIPRAMRILGQMALRSPMDMPQGMPGAPMLPAPMGPAMSPEGAPMGPTPMESMGMGGMGTMPMPVDPAADVMAALDKAFSTTFDVVVSEKSVHPSIQQQQFDLLLSIEEAKPGSVPPDVLTEGAKNAGILTEDMAVRMLQYQQQQQMAQNATIASTAQSGSPPPKSALE